MTVTSRATEEASLLAPVSHPLDPLTADEIAVASSILRAEQQLGARVRFETVVLYEPDKKAVLDFQPGDAVPRSAFIVILDNDTASTYEAVVSLDERRVVSWKHIPGVQPRVMFDEFVECEAMVRADPQFLAAIGKRGITDPSLVMVDPWSAGNYGYEEEEGRRLVLARCFVRSGPSDNGYARPIEGVTVVVDLNSMEVVRVDDYGLVPLPPNEGNYGAEFAGRFREDLKPLDITQPEGASFEVKGWGVTWQKWHLRVGFTPREGLVIHNVGYEDQGRVLDRAAVDAPPVEVGLHAGRPAVGHEPLGRHEADDAVAPGRLPARSAGFFADRAGGQVRADRHRRPRARAAGLAGRVVDVARRTGPTAARDARAERP